MSTIWIIVIAVVVLYVAWSVKEEYFPSREKKEEYISELMNIIPLSSDSDEKCKEMCRPIKIKDLAGRKLNDRIIYSLAEFRSPDFAADTVMHAEMHLG